jgi:hypothetical protein
MGWNTHTGAPKPGTGRDYGHSRARSGGRVCVAALHRPARQNMILPMEPVQHVQLTVRLPVQYPQEGAWDIAHAPGYRRGQPRRVTS